MLQVFSRLLKSDHVPFARNVLFNGTFSASSRPRIPAQCAAACLLRQTVGPAVVETEESLRSWAQRKTGLALPEVTR